MKCGIRLKQVWDSIWWRNEWKNNVMMKTLRISVLLISVVMELLTTCSPWHVCSLCSYCTCISVVCNKSKYFYQSYILPYYVWGWGWEQYFLFRYIGSGSLSLSLSKSFAFPSERKESKPPHFFHPAGTDFCLNCEISQFVHCF